MGKSIIGIKLVIKENGAVAYGIGRTARDTRYLAGKMKLIGGFADKKALKESLVIAVPQVLEPVVDIQP